MRSERGEEVVQVVADGLIGSHEAGRGTGDARCGAEVTQREQRVGVVAEVVQSDEELLEPAAELGRPAKGRDSGQHGVVEGRQRAPQLRGAGLEAARRSANLARKGSGRAATPGHLERRRALADRVLKGARVAPDRREDVCHVGQPGDLGGGHRRGLPGVRPSAGNSPRSSV